MIIIIMDSHNTNRNDHSCWKSQRNFFQWLLFQLHGYCNNWNMTLNSIYIDGQNLLMELMQTHQTVALWWSTQPHEYRLFDLYDLLFKNAEPWLPRTASLIPGYLILLAESEFIIFLYFFQDTSEYFYVCWKNCPCWV